MKTKTMVLGLGFAALVYLVLFFYIFGLAPAVSSSSQAAWLDTELSHKPKFSDTEICKECHYQLYIGMINHSTVNCEACHGSGVEHTIKRTSDTIEVNKSRDACLKCHLDVGGRNAIRTVSDEHYAGVYCVVCHDPHK